MAENVLVVAFDGMDKELIDKFGLEHVKQKEFGQIDNHTGIKNIKTGELFASFITGETWETHGVTMVKRWNSPVMNRVENLVPKQDPFYSWAAKVKDLLKGVSHLDREPYTKEDLSIPTLFDKIPDSKAVNVPSYSVNPGIEAFSYVLDRYGVEFAEREAEKEFAIRQQELLDELQTNKRDFLMAHFHYIDFMNHLYGDPVQDEEKLAKKYEKADAVARTILDAAGDTYDTIIFMSDHGLPTVNEHNKQAFYSVNAALDLDTPHITDFHDIVLDHVDTEQGGLQGIEI